MRYAGPTEKRGHRRVSLVLENLATAGRGGPISEYGKILRADVSSENRRGVNYIYLLRVTEWSVDTRRWPRSPGDGPVLRKTLTPPPPVDFHAVPHPRAVSLRQTPGGGEVFL